MNVKGFAEKIDRKTEALKRELSKPREFQNKETIRRLEESIKRNKQIMRNVCKKRWNKRKRWRG